MQCSGEMNTAAVYHSSLSEVNMLRECNLCTSRTIEQTLVSVYRVYSGSMDKILFLIYEVYYTM
jgi:hypothetical protein